MELKNDSIVLRPFTLDDAEDHLRGEDAEMARWVSGGKSTLESVQSWIHENQRDWENDGPRFTFAIVETKTNILIGFIEANHDFEKLEHIKQGEVNISYGLYPQYRGKGYAIQAVKLVIDFLKNQGAKKAVIAIDPENINSLRIPENLGFKKTDEILTAKNDPLIIFEKSLN